MFEYDTQIALDAGEIVKGILTVEFPHSAVLYLRHNTRTPDAMTVRIKTPGGEISYQIPVMKTQQADFKWRNQRIHEMHDCGYVPEGHREDYREV
ncbi:MAG: hypothetical protein SPE99_01765 [Blautia sp.]|nr:hypothetical protein [Blautia sp.]